MPDNYRISPQVRQSMERLDQDALSLETQTGLSHGRPASGKLSEAQECLSRGDLDAAQAFAGRALLDDGRSADAHSLMASIFDRRGDWETSLAHLHRAHELMPGGPQVRLNLAMALLRLGNYREGLALYEARLDKATWSGFATPQSRAALRDRLLRRGGKMPVSALCRLCCKSRLRPGLKRDSVMVTRFSARSIHDGPFEE